METAANAKEQATTVIEEGENTDEKAAKKRKRQLDKFAQRMAFSKFVDGCRVPASPSKTPGKQNPGEPYPGEQTPVEQAWSCCQQSFTSPRDIHQHVSRVHHQDIAQSKERMMYEGAPDAKWKLLRKDKPSSGDTAAEDAILPLTLTSQDRFEWLPGVDDDEFTGDSKGQVLLFYKYCDIKSPEHVLNWQKELCRRLKLTGKVRIGREGINATVAGRVTATELYIRAMRSHHFFSDMDITDFKTSPGDESVFPDGLKIGIYAEIVPMGVDPKVVSFKDTGTHLKPEEFHAAIEKLARDGSASDSVLIDCRNFYESKIGKFEGALTPDLRKFSYWPEYVDSNIEIFKDKKVYMYCTGGIRCERGSAYLKAKGINDVFQLEGGIHKYIEKYPDGFYRGKLFVFDDRYTIKSNDDVLSKCRYCETDWDGYRPCSSMHCHQLVLTCDACRDRGRTACCPLCQENCDRGVSREECTCTKNRPRIPIETLPGSKPAASNDNVSQ